jgi:hypothetical protein
MKFSDATTSLAATPRYDGTTILLHWLTAGLVAAVGWTAPPLTIEMSAGAPSTAVAVATGVDCDVEILSCACAGKAAATRHNGPSATAANKDERMDNP